MTTRKKIWHREQMTKTQLDNFFLKFAHCVWRWCCRCRWMYIMVSCTEKKKSKMRFCPSFFVVLPIPLRRPRQSFEFNSICTSCNRKIISGLTPNRTHAHKIICKAICRVMRTNMCNKYAHEIIANHDSEKFQQIWTFFHSGQVSKEHYFGYVCREINLLFALHFRDRRTVLFATNSQFACIVDGSVVHSPKKKENKKKTNSLHPWSKFHLITLLKVVSKNANT